MDKKAFQKNLFLVSIGVLAIIVLVIGVNMNMRVSASGGGGGEVCQVLWKNDFGRKLSKVNENSNVEACCIDADQNDSSCKCHGNTVTNCLGAYSQLHNNGTCTGSDDKIIDFAGCKYIGNTGCGVSNVSNSRSAACKRNDAGTSNEEEAVVSEGQELWNHTSNSSLGVHVFNESGTTVVQEDCGTAVEISGRGKVYIADKNPPSYCTSTDSHKDSLEAYDYEVKQVQIYRENDKSRRLSKLAGKSEIMACCMDTDSGDDCDCGGISSNDCGTIMGQLYNLKVWPNESVKVIDHTGTCNLSTVGCGINTRTNVYTQCKRQNRTGQEDTVVSMPLKVFNATSNSSDSNYSDFKENGTTIATEFGATVTISGDTFYVFPTGWGSENVNSWYNDPSYSPDSGRTGIQQDLNTSLTCTEGANCTGLGFTEEMCLDTDRDGNLDTCGENYPGQSDCDVLARIRYETKCCTGYGTGSKGVCAAGAPLAPGGSYGAGTCEKEEVVWNPDDEVFIDSCAHQPGLPCDSDVDQNGYAAVGICAGSDSEETCDTGDVVRDMNGHSGEWYHDCSNINDGVESTSFNYANSTCDSNTNGTFIPDSVCVRNAEQDEFCQTSGTICEYESGDPVDSRIYYDDCSLCGEGSDCTTSDFIYPVTFEGTCDEYGDCT
jgi:hypothetical protein